jgi:anti-sigma-K factor RskA
VSADPFAEYDAAYVLGALSDDERVAFEQHLGSCASCRASVQSLSELPPLLAQMTDVAAIEDAAPAPPPALLPELLDEVGRQRRRRRWYTAGIAAAAACIVALGILIAVQISGGGTSGSPVAMRQVTTSPMHATALLQPTAWGTRIQLACSYDAGRTYSSDVSYSLRAVDLSGGSHDLGSWRLVAGGVTTFDSGVSVPPNQLARLEVLSTTTGSEILELEL